MITLRARAAAPSLADPLEVGGPFAYIRHPIYAGSLLDLVAILLGQPRATVARACALLAVWVVIQSRLEERDLLQRLPAYREYMGRVPRFIPRAR